MRNVLAFLLGLCLALPMLAYALTVAPTTRYSYSGAAGTFPTAMDAVQDRLWNMRYNNVDSCDVDEFVSLVGTTATFYSYDATNPCTTPADVATNGAYRNTITITSSATSCPAGTYLKGSVCTDTVQSDLSCKRGGLETGLLPYAGLESLGKDLMSATTLSTLPMAKMNGCSFYIAKLNNQCELNGAVAWCVDLIGVGSAAASGDHGLMSPGTTGTGVPSDPTTSCGQYKVVNVSSGVTTCIDPTPSKPLEKVTSSVSADGAVGVQRVVSTAANGGGSVTETLAIPATGSAPASGLASGVVGGSGSSSGYTPNCVDTECTVRIDGADVVSGSGTFTTATSALDTAATSRETAITALSGAGKVTTLGLALDFAFPTTGSCTPFHWDFKGYTYDYDWCTDLGTVRNLWGWMVGILGALYIWRSGRTANA